MFGFARFLSESTLDQTKLSQLHAAVMDDMPRDVLADFAGDLGVPDRYADFLRAGNVKGFIEQSQVGARGRGQTLTCHMNVGEAHQECRYHKVIAGWYNAMVDTGYVFTINHSQIAAVNPGFTISATITVNYSKPYHQFYLGWGPGAWYDLPVFYDRCLALSDQLGINVVGFDVFWLGLMLYHE